MVNDLRKRRDGEHSRRLDEDGRHERRHERGSPANAGSSPRTKPGAWERRWPPYFYDPRFMPPYYAWIRPFWFDFPTSLEREQALVDFCMHSKGYRLERLTY